MLRSTTMNALLVFLLITITISGVDCYQAPDLPVGDINLVVVSDVHSFVGGHPHEPDRNADYGDLYSFHEQLKPHCDHLKKDCWLLNNGDFLHGTGLAMDGNATSLLPIIREITWDAMNMGNHEAMYSAVLHDMREQLLPSLPGKYMTSNVLWKQTMEPFGERYQLLKGNFSTVLLFGFMYEMENPSETIEVERIADVVEKEWFIDALAENEYDAIVVMAHVDQESPNAHTIYKAIRSHVDAKMPIQFITGHTHKRLYVNRIGKDHYVSKMEPGGMFDTIGFVSMPTFQTAQEKEVKEMQNEFGHKFLNTSRTVLHDALRIRDDKDLKTPKGEEIFGLIQDTQQKLGLDQVVACPGRDYFRNMSVYHDDSLWRLWREHVIPSQLFLKSEHRLMLVGKDTFRYDLRGSGKHDAMTLDDVIAIAPYMERVIYIGEVPDWMVRRLNQTLNTFSAHNLIPDYVMAGQIESYKTVEAFKLYTHEVDVPAIVAKLEKYNFQDFKLKPIGKRSTIYWLDYVMSAMPCNGQENEYEIVPYFYDPSELEEESTDGGLSEDIEVTDDTFEPEENQKPEEDGQVWTLPPGGYAGYVPGGGDAHKIPPAKYDNFDESTIENKPIKHSSLSDKKARIEKRKKFQKSILKGIALTIATGVLLIPVVCGVMQLTGRWKDEDDIGFYDREEVKSLRRHRRRGGKGAPPPPATLRDMRPVGEIEIC
ncbi:MAG: hypothetical protein SGILL_007616 [Bacillariaceae sp.]